MLLIAESGAGERFEMLEWLEGFSTSPLLLMLALALGTLLSEDLSCIAGGLVAAKGWIPVEGAIAACAFGIWVGDLGLYGVGYYVSHKRNHWRWLDKIVSPARVERGKRMFERYGFWWIVISRFLPGMRLPAYVAAGVVGWSFKTFVALLAIAVWIWTPMLVGLTYAMGKVVLGWVETYRTWAWPVVGALILLIFAVDRLLIPSLTWRGRRLLLSRWTRFRRWEFWPMWMVYPPVLLSLLGQAFRYRSLTVFTAANPAIPAGGFAMESKGDILEALKTPDESALRVARFTRWPAGLPVSDRLRLLREFLDREGLNYPVVLKPDVGERGRGVKIVHSEEEAREWCTHCHAAAMAQEYVEGLEYGVQWMCFPHQDRGVISSIARKHTQFVIGNGQQTLERLILDDPRAVMMADYYLSKFATRLNDIPEAGEKVWLASIGTHARGAVFTDARGHATPDLLRVMDQVGHAYEGFFFGRYDLRVPSAEDLRRGRKIVVLELNGVTGEPLHVYQPGYPWRVGMTELSRHWRHACEIGALNRARGVRVWTLGELSALIRAHRRSEWFEADELEKEKASHD